MMNKNFGQCQIATCQRDSYNKNLDQCKVDTFQRHKGYKPKNRRRNTFPQDNNCCTPSALQSWRRVDIYLLSIDSIRRSH